MIIWEKEKYPVVKENFELHLTAKECSLFYIIKANEKKITDLGLKKFTQWTISPLLARYLTLCNGKRSHKEISDILSLPFSFLINQSVERLIKETSVLELKDSEEVDMKKINITGSFESYNPIHMAVEITDYCNFRCKHCYVSASPEKLAKRELKETLKLIDLLYDKGVKVIELTGGECTTHPNFKEILEYASKKFCLVAIITNGYIIGNDNSLAEFIGSIPNVAVQISVDGLEKYHDEFRNMNKAFEKAITAIKNLKEQGVVVRVATTVTEENVDNLEELFNILDNLDIDSWSISAVSSFGRGSCLTCSHGENALNSKLLATLGRYSHHKMFNGNKISVQDRINNKEINCGAGWRSFALNGATGNVRMCLLLDNNAILGNIDKENYEEIFNKKKLDIFKRTPSPSISLDTCKSCKYKQRCNGCMAKAFETAKNYNKDCRWVKKYELDKYIR